MNRSDCPISNALDHLGDRWSLLVIRDIAFFGKKTYSELLESSEGIATNILSSRLKNLEAGNIIKRKPNPSDRRRHIYSLTESGKDLLPILIEMILWSAKHYSDMLDIPSDLVQKAKEDRDALI
ncbi:MAG: helix-turn-helix transcriptional regulator, partial [Desulfobacterales bacterium]|nr:helix-turn-helix transcriptional regulator [Desulfobacterales bacterium]